jgi:hypothetical protein
MTLTLEEKRLIKKECKNDVSMALAEEGGWGLLTRHEDCISFLGKKQYKILLERNLNI